MAGPGVAALAGTLLAALSAGEVVGQPGGLFRAVAPSGVTVAGPPSSTDSLTLRRRLVSIDFGQLAAPVDGGRRRDRAVRGAAVEPLRRRVVHGPRRALGADLLGADTRCRAGWPALRSAR